MRGSKKFKRQKINWIFEKLSPVLALYRFHEDPSFVFGLWLTWVNVETQSYVNDWFGTKTNNRLFPRINQLFWFWQQVNHTNNFQPFLKTPKYKTISCFDKTTGCFSLSLKKTYLLKGLRVLKMSATHNPAVETSNALSVDADIQAQGPRTTRLEY